MKYNCFMIKKGLELVFIFSFLFLILPPKVYAYLDPGSGSYLIQIIVASLAGVGYFVKSNWQAIKRFFSRRGKKETDGKKTTD